MSLVRVLTCSHGTIHIGDRDITTQSLRTLRQSISVIPQVCCSALQCVAVRCSVLQCAAVCCSVLQCVAVRCSVLPCVAGCCSVLQSLRALCQNTSVIL